MKIYSLYLESGPRQKTTMVHVLDLLGCIAKGATTEAALVSSPGAIGEYLHFLHKIGEDVQMEEDFSTEIAEHVMEGSWLGYGDPTPGFTPDFQTLELKDLSTYRQRLSGLQAGLMQLVGSAPQEQLLTEPARGGRSVYRMMEHVAESDAIYLRYLVGKVDGLADALRAIKDDPPALQTTLPRLWKVISERIATFSQEDCQQQVGHGQVIWTARRAVRRMLEHEWEHYIELSSRLGIKIW